MRVSLSKMAHKIIGNSLRKGNSILLYIKKITAYNVKIFQSIKNLQQQQHSIFSQASWGRLEMKPERNKFKVQAH